MRTAQDFVEALEWLHEDIELALEEHDITAYRPQAGKDSFDGRRHSVVGNPIPTTDPNLSRLIERCVRPGFERDGKVVARAAVRIYRHDEKQERPIEERLLGLARRAARKELTSAR